MTELNYTDAQIQSHIGMLDANQQIGAVGMIRTARDMLRSLLAERQAAMQRQGGEEWDVMVDRLAKYIFQQESNKCSTMDAAIHHRSQWRRGIPEARAMLKAAIQPPQPVRSVSDDECPACHKNWGEHRFGYSASRCTMKKQQPPVKIVSNEDVEAALKVWNDAPALGREEDDAYAMRAVLEHFAAIAQEKQS